MIPVVNAPDFPIPTVENASLNALPTTKGFSNKIPLPAEKAVAVKEAASPLY